MTVRHYRATFSRYAVILVPRHRSLVLDFGTHHWLVTW